MVLVMRSNFLLKVMSRAAAFRTDVVDEDKLHTCHRKHCYRDIHFLTHNALKCICAVLGSHVVRLSVRPSVRPSVCL